MLFHERFAGSVYADNYHELEFLSCLIEEEKAIRQKSGKEYKAWIKEAKHAFQNFVHNLELKRRREDGNLEQRIYHDALNNFKCLMKEFDSFETAVRKKLMIEELWQILQRSTLSVTLQLQTIP